MKIVLVENIHNAGIELLKARGFDDITLIKDSPKEQDLIDILQTADAIGIRTRTKLTKEILQNVKKVRAIGCACIGTDQVDLEFAGNIGLPVFNAPFGNTRSVAELTIGEMIMLARKVPDKFVKMQNGIWDKSLQGCFEIKGKTIGIIGYGHIGSQVGVLAEALSMNVIYYDIERKQNFGGAKPSNSLEELLKKSDVVTIHVPNLPSTKDMIGKKEFALMKKGAIFLNLARGNVVDFDALANAIESEHLMGCAVDAYKVEPKNKDEEFVNVLRKFKSNVILTPHIGGLTEEAQIAMAVDMTEKMANFLQYGNTNGAVNFPEINASYKPNIDRILHIHKNIPGVMMELNKIFGEIGLNIESQHLNTKNNIGYGVIDTKKESINAQVIDKLNAVKGTIKVIKSIM
ncbi:MAG: phosphoglycerate dehydrogenase [Rickettsiales bacterium]|jgi:D-3-phosphoglycerate dehydrogenase|nr:phosphoglycerate dehydrogenase [Rickettsiales bacterium]